MFARGPPLKDSEEAKILAYRKAMDFAIDTGFTDLIIEGDNVAVMKSITSPGANQSWLGHIIQDIQWLAQGLRWVRFSYVNRGANSVARSLAQYAKNVMDDMFWMEDAPPPAINALYHESLQLNEWKTTLFSKKKKKGYGPRDQPSRGFLFLSFFFFFMNFYFMNDSYSYLLSTRLLHIILLFYFAKWTLSYGYFKPFGGLHQWDSLFKFFSFYLWKYSTLLRGSK